MTGEIGNTVSLIFFRFSLPIAAAYSRTARYAIRSQPWVEAGRFCRGRGIGMASRIWKNTLLGLAVIAAIAPFCGDAARADEDCIAVADIGASIDKFLGGVSVAQAAGQGRLPITDVLFGVTEISEAHQQDLAKRELVQLKKRDAAGGDYVNRGAGRITVEGVFAERGTLFRIPSLVMGRYVLGEEGVTLLYDPAHTVEVGERVLGIRFFKAMNHTVITKTKLSFFFEDNDGGEPDRCYDVVRE